MFEFYPNKEIWFYNLLNDVSLTKSYSVKWIVESEKWRVDLGLVQNAIPKYPWDCWGKSQNVEVHLVVVSTEIWIRYLLLAS